MLKTKIIKNRNIFDTLFIIISDFLLPFNKFKIDFRILPPSKGYIGTKLNNAINKLE